MTESEAQQLIEEMESAFGTDSEPLELEWIGRQLDALLKEEREHIYLFRLHRSMRDDERMNETAVTVRKVRAAIAYLEGRRGEIENARLSAS